MGRREESMSNEGLNARKDSEKQFDKAIKEIGSMTVTQIGRS
jgi:hypothetical protein